MLIYPNKVVEDRSIKDMVVFNGVKGLLFGMPILFAFAFRYRSRLVALRKPYARPLSSEKIIAQNAAEESAASIRKKLKI